MKKLLAFLLLVPQLAWGQAAVQQAGSVTNNSSVMWARDHQIRKGAGAGGAIAGQIITGGDAAVGGRCDYSAPIDAVGGYYSLCLDATNGKITFDGTKSPPIGPYLEFNGATYPLLGSGGGGDVFGPDVSADGEAVVFNGTTGKLLRRGGVTTNAALKTLDVTGAGPSTWIQRQAFATPGDGGAVLYLYSSSPCTLGAGAGDDGSQVRASDGNCWLAQFPQDGADGRAWGAKPDAVPGVVGAACSGITGTDNSAALQAAINYAFDTGGRVVLGGNGFYRINTRLDFVGTTQYWNSNKKAPEIDIKQPLVYCGDDAAVYFKSDVEGSRIRLARLIGQGAGASAPVAGSHAENVGVYMEGAAWWDITVDAVSDFTYDVLFDGSFGNKVKVGTAIASYKAIYLRAGAVGTACAGCGSAGNYVTFANVGGPYTANTDPDHAARVARSSFRGIHLEAGQGNNIIGGAAQYSVKPGGINLEVDDSENFVSAFVEGHIASGSNVLVTGNDNLIRLSALGSPSTGLVTNLSVTGFRNTVYGPLESAYGTFHLDINNFMNGDPSLAAYTPTVTCSAGSPVDVTGTARYRRIGAMVWVEANWNATDIGTCSGVLRVTIPPGITLSTTNSNSISGFNLTSGASNLCRLDASSSWITVQTTASGAFPATNGQTGVCSGWFDIES